MDELMAGDEDARVQQRLHADRFGETLERRPAAVRQQQRKRPALLPGPRLRLAPLRRPGRRSDPLPGPRMQLAPLQRPGMRSAPLLGPRMRLAPLQRPGMRLAPLPRQVMT